MPLEEYRRKRHFEKTPEPSGEKPKAKRAAKAKLPAAAKGRSFVVQKHAATRLHYDFRIELDGVLLSWAVPKGPSLDPADKRLAVHVEDHPVDYGGFEGVIPKGEYGGGTVMVWDRGWWEPDHGDPVQHLADGHLKFYLHGEKLRGKWMLVRTRFRDAEPRDQWLLFKERDDEARPRGDHDVLVDEPASAVSGRTIEQIAADQDTVWHSDQPATAQTGAKAEVAKAAHKAGEAATRSVLRAPASIEGAVPGPLPEVVEPELATLVDVAPEGDAWLHEVKYDGYRVMLRIADGRVRAITRRGHDWTDRFPTVVHAAERLGVETALLDGEVVYLRSDGTTDFQALQNSLRAGSPAKNIGYFAFDLLHLDGHDLRRAALTDRKAALRGILPEDDDVLRYSDHLAGNGPAFLSQTCTYALEGAVSKRADSPYRSGRGKDWLKSKCTKLQEFVVVGWTDPGGSRTGFGALVLGVHDGGELRLVGRVGTGFSQASIRDIMARLEPLATEEPPVANVPEGAAARGVHWVRPELVCDVAFIEWTNDGGIRHPSFQGLREDKTAAEVVREREEPAAEAAEEAVIEAVGEPAPPAPARETAPAEKPRAKPGRPRKKGKGSGVIVSGIELSNPDRVYYPDVHVTKVDMAHYYEQVAEWMLPHLKDRPLTMVRCPEGFTHDCFYHKHVEDGFHASVRHVPIEESGVVRDYGYVRDVTGIVSLVQMGVLEIHTWGARTDDVEKPDRLVFDLDPDADLPWTTVTGTAQLIRSELERLGLQSFAKTTGGKGLHVVVPVTRVLGWRETRDFTKAFVDSIVAQAPDLFTANMSKAKRGGKIFIDYVRNTRGATAIAAYSTRSRPGATVSVPVSWQEVAEQRTRPEWSVGDVPQRLRKLKADPWADITKVRQRITKDARKRLGLEV